MEILLFSHDAGYSAAAVEAGMDGVVVDWECSGKARRQAGQDTEINHGTVADLDAARPGAAGKLICRINNTPAGRDVELRLAIEHGASEIWLPMVRRIGELESCLRVIDGAARLGALVETREAMTLGRELEQLPLSRVYVGLHDFRIERGHPGLFDPIVDGTIDRFRDRFGGALGFAGVTDPDGGSPVPQCLLLAAMVRLRCAFGVARRRFRADVGHEQLPRALQRIRQHVQSLASRTSEQVREDQAALARVVAEISDPRPTAMEVSLACAR